MRSQLEEAEFALEMLTEAGDSLSGSEAGDIAAQVGAATSLQ
jgi:hypothetical protein